MTVTTDEDWLVNGVSLQTYARNITSWGGSLQASPPLRGDDVEIPGIPGRMWVPKVADTRAVEFSGWIIGADDDGNIVDVTTFRKNWRALRALFYGSNRQITLTRKWRDAFGALQSATALGQVQDGIMPEMDSPTRANWVIPVTLADPFFYGDFSSIPMLANQTANIDVKGDEETTVVEVEFLGPLTTARLTLGTQFVEISGVEAGAVVVFNAREFTALKTVGGVTTNIIGSLVHGKGTPWLKAVPGSMPLVYTKTGTGTTTLRFRPAYF